AFLAQSETNFLYGTGDNPEESRAGQDEKSIEDAFGKYTPMVLLVPNGDLAREDALVTELDNLDEVKSSVSYVGTIGTGVRAEYWDEADQERVFADTYSRITLNTTTDPGGGGAFALAETVRGRAADCCRADVRVLGECATIYGMRD